MIDIEKQSTKHYCNQLAIERGLDPIGYAGDFDDAIIIELPLPWKRNLREQSGILPGELISLFDLWLKQYHEGHGYRHRPLFVAPDPDYSCEGARKVMFYKRPKGLSANFEKFEYIIPEEKLGMLVWSLYETRHLLAEFEQYRVTEGDQTRDILVCTHGAVDAACAKFGYPLYKSLRDDYANDNLRVWRVSHFGGHVFAPTVMDLPSGRYWAYIQDGQIEPLVNHSGDVSAMRGHFRGSALVGNSFVQVLDCELWQRHGWEWFTYDKIGMIIGEDQESEEPQWADVEMRYHTGHDSKIRIVRARVEVSHSVETHPSTGQDRTYAYPQYKATRLEELA